MAVDVVRAAAHRTSPIRIKVAEVRDGNRESVEEADGRQRRVENANAAEGQHVDALVTLKLRAGLGHEEVHMQMEREEAQHAIIHFALGFQLTFERCSIKLLVRSHADAAFRDALRRHSAQQPLAQRLRRAARALSVGN